MLPGELAPARVPEPSKGAVAAVTWPAARTELEGAAASRGAGGPDALGAGTDETFWTVPAEAPALGATAGKPGRSDVPRLTGDGTDPDVGVGWATGAGWTTGTSTARGAPGCWTGCWADGGWP